MTPTTPGTSTGTTAQALVISRVTGRGVVRADGVERSGGTGRRSLPSDATTTSALFDCA